MRPKLSAAEFVFILGCLFLLVAMLVLALKRFWQRHFVFHPRPDLRERKLDNIYLRSLSRGIRPRELVRVYSQMDMALIRSILSSARIPSDVLFPLMNTLRTGVAIEGYNDSILRVLNPDYYRARELVQDYLRRRKADTWIPMRMRFRNLVECLVAGVVVNPLTPLPELSKQTHRVHPRSARPTKATEARSRTAARRRV